MIRRVCHRILHGHQPLPVLLSWGAGPGMRACARCLNDATHDGRPWGKGW